MIIAGALFWFFFARPDEHPFGRGQAKKNKLKSAKRKNAMNDTISVNEDGSPVVYKNSLGARIFAQLFSYLFHPLFIPVYVILFLAYLHPSAFTGFSEHARRQSVFIVILNIVFFPLISVLLLRAVGFIDSIYLHTKKDRIIPYMACGIFFFWAYTVFKEQPRYPLLLTSFIFGIFLASSAGLMANIYYKISLHAIGMGGWLGFFAIIAAGNSMHMSWPLAAVIILTGAVCTARLIISDHSRKDVYTGLIVGFVCQVVAAWFVM